MVADAIPMGTDVPEEPYVIPFGRAEVKREGTDVTVVATMLMVHKAIHAAKILEEEDISVEVIDPRTLVPLDRGTIAASVKKTSRAIVVTEDNITCGTSAELAQTVYEVAYHCLKAPVIRVASLDSPIPHAPAGEQFMIPTKEKIADAIRQVVGRKACLV
ncbi:MAG: hypothetical protein HYX78_03740 [Armatimonadetes bacterium]|nr:hypothetical protein [Armatimonadota bacterium]